MMEHFHKFSKKCVADKATKQKGQTLKKYENK